jgi:lysophospholipase L1-like esterase
VARLAIEHGDVIVLVRHQGKDGIHPSRSGYARLATLTRVSVGPGVQIIDERLQ